MIPAERIFTGEITYSLKDQYKMKKVKCCLTCKSHVGAGCTNRRGENGPVGDNDWCNAWKPDQTPIRAIFRGGV